ncbi:hypothetical protein [Cerasicoccus fimbriatus]|uniref:hypothetical protein n=1 Tax=Cerasicoccus fimbriatus TaxID=3014554 RepID=UPI0022B590F9|nr:hypothetical protein [Cerasicoccus sp. TK19100]
MAYARPSLIFILTLLLCTTKSFAQQNNQAETAPPQFRVVCLTDALQAMYDNGKDDEAHINISMSNLSRLYTAYDRRVTFYQEVENPDPTKPPLRQTIAQVTLPNGPGPFLVLMQRAQPGSEIPYETMVIDHSLEQHQANSYRLFNFSHRNLAVSLADKQFLLQPREAEYVVYPDKRKAWLKVAVDSEDNGWIVAQSSPHVVGQDTRTMIFLCDIPPTERDPNPLGIAVRKFRERITTDEFGVQHIR